MEITEIRRTKRKKREAEKRKKTGKRKTENDKERNGIKPQALYNHAQGFLVTKKRSGKTGSFFHLSLKTIRRAVCKASRRKCPIPRSRAFCICRRKAIPLPCSCSCRPLRQPSRSDICGRFEHDCRIFSASSALRSGGFGRFWLPWASAGKHRADRQTRKHHTKCSRWFRNTPLTTDSPRKSELLSLFSPRSIRHFPNCRRKQTKTEILFSYLIIFEVNNRFVAFSIDKNFQKSTEIGSQFHNLPPACSSVSPASSLSFSLRPPLPSVSLLLRPYSSEVTAAASQPPLSPLRPIYPPRPPTRLAQFCVSRARRPAAPTRFFSSPAYITLQSPTCLTPLLPSLSPCDHLSHGCSPSVSLPPRPPPRFFSPPAYITLQPPTCLSPLLPSLSPCDRLSPAVPRLFLSRRVLMLPQFPPVAPTAAFLAPAYITPPCPPTCPASFCISLSAYPASAISFSLQSSSLPVSRLFLSQPLFSLSSRRPTYTAVFLTRLPFPITFLSPYPPAAYLASLPSVSLPPASSFSRSALPPPLNRRFPHFGGLFDALSLCPISFLQSKKDVPKARLFLQAFFYSLHSSSAAKTSGLRPNVSCQIPRILRPHQTSVRINIRLPENIICR